MGNRFRISWAVLAALALTLLGTGGAMAQTQTMKTDVLIFEVISVDGNNVVVRDQNGTRELTVPDDFRFTVDGKPMSVHDLAQGMKGTATVTTTTTVRPVYVTVVKKGVVLDQVGSSVSVRTEEGIRRFTQSELDKRGVRIFIDGNPVRVSQLQKGDQLSATIVTSGPPEVLTEKQVQAELAATPAVAEPAVATTAETPAATETPSAEAPAAASEKPAATAGDEPVKSDDEQADRRWIWIALVAIVVAGFLLMRKRRAKQ